MVRKVRSQDKGKSLAEVTFVVGGDFLFLTIMTFRLSRQLGKWLLLLTFFRTYLSYKQKPPVFNHTSKDQNFLFGKINDVFL